VRVVKVALVKAPWWVRYCPPYILAYFATYLRTQGHEAFCFDLNNILYHESDDGYRRYWDDRDYYSYWENTSFVSRLIDGTGCEGYISRILETDARVIVFDTHTPSVLISLEIARRIKARDSKRIIVFFGHKATRAQMAFDFIEHPCVDYVCPGEADLALSALLKKLESLGDAAPLPECKGFLSKRNGAVVDGGAPEAVADLDSLPFPDYRDFAEDIRQGRYAQPERLDILDSRGCINGCHFCYERLFWGGKYRTMSGRRIFEQMRYHQQQFPGIRFFYFNGLLLNGDLRSLEEFCDLVIRHNMKIQWAGQAVARADMDRKLLLKMRRAGCVWLGYGIESGSQKVLDTMNKKVVIDRAVQVLKDTRDAGIPFQINMMFGFPTETDEEFQQTLDFLVRVRPYIDTVLASQSFFTLEKGTYLRTHPEEFGITRSDHHLFWESDGGHNTYPERFRRYEAFCHLAIKLGIPQTSGVLAVKPDKWFLLGEYYRFEKEYQSAANCYIKSLELESRNDTTLSRLNECLSKVKGNEKDPGIS
jgi:radical SAM superfamily enzyme YgiQ (UPF0313 family)